MNSFSRQGKEVGKETIVKLDIHFPDKEEIYNS